MRTSTFGFPPFTRAVKQLVYINVAVFLSFYVLKATAPDFANRLLDTTGLVPYAVLHGYPDFPIPHIWQLVTYSFVHAGVLHILFNMLSLWMFGSTLEQDWGAKRFREFYFFCVV